MTHEDTSGSSSQSPTSLTSFGCALKAVQLQRWLKTSCISNNLGKESRQKPYYPSPQPQFPH